MSKRMDAKREKAKRALATWYKLKPVSLALPMLLLVGLWVPPIARGEPFEWSTLQTALWGTSIAVLLALLLGWLAWRVSFRSVGVANTVFSLVVIGCGVWSIALSDLQRARTQVEVAGAIDHQVVKVKRTVLTMME